MCQLDFTIVIVLKEVQIVYRLFLVNCYLLHIPRLPSQPTSNARGGVIDFFGLNCLDSTVYILGQYTFSFSYVVVH